MRKYVIIDEDGLRVRSYSNPLDARIKAYRLSKALKTEHTVIEERVTNGKAYNV